MPRAGKTSFTQTDTDTTNPNEPAHYRTVTTTTTDAFRFTIQFARRIGPFTGRFGIKESTGGVGVDTLLGGAEHIFLPNRRDYFIGGPYGVVVAVGVGHGLAGAGAVGSVTVTQGPGSGGTVVVG